MFNWAILQGSPSPRRDPHMEVRFDQAHAPDSMREWLSASPIGDHLRLMERNNRIREGIARWAVDGLDGPAVCCYERAAGRVANERPGCAGRPDARFVAGLLHDRVLPTAVANSRGITTW